VATIELQPGGSGAFAMIAINLARDWESLKDAFRFHPSPTNFHYADVDGNHGWQVIGFMPVRRKGDGLMPVPGDGRYDWTGMRDFRALPSEYNPAKGWFASANQNNLPPDWPRDRIPAFSFRAPYRYDRIAEVLAAQPRHGLADSVALQHDTVSTPARRLIALLPAAARPVRSRRSRCCAAGTGGWTPTARRPPCSKSCGASSAPGCFRRSCRNGRARW
jgi:penicillin amidase